LIPEVAATLAVFLAALLASCFLGALAPVFFLAVCLVLAIFLIETETYLVFKLNYNNADGGGLNTPPKCVMTNQITLF
jgi:hypothetical protein